MYITAFLVFSSFSITPKNEKNSGKDKYKVMVFMAEECPICQYHTLDLKNLYKKHINDPVKFELVFSNSLSNRKSMKAFRYKYILPFKTHRDHKLKIAKKYQISTTPEVIVLKNNKEIIYRGKMSNAFAAIGVRRRVINEFYLADALEAALNGKTIDPISTEPVGCLITYPKKK